MRRIALMLVVLALGCRGRETPADSPAVAESQPIRTVGLDGRWVVESCYTDGVPDPEEVGASVTLVGGRMTVAAPGAAVEAAAYEVVLRADAIPAEMDLVYEQKLAANGDLPAATRKQAIRCIYKLEGDTLTICGSTHEQDCRGDLCVSGRPTAFAPTGVEKQFLQVLRRSEGR